MSGGLNWEIVEAESDSSAARQPRRWRRSWGSRQLRASSVDSIRARDTASEHGVPVGDPRMLSYQEESHATRRGVFQQQVSAERPLSVARATGEPQSGLEQDDEDSPMPTPSDRELQRRLRDSVSKGLSHLQRLVKLASTR